jgi:hypothetical protein
MRKQFDPTHVSGPLDPIATESLHARLPQVFRGQWSLFYGGCWKAFIGDIHLRDAPNGESSRTHHSADQATRWAVQEYKRVYRLCKRLKGFKLVTMTPAARLELRSFTLQSLRYKHSGRQMPVPKLPTKSPPVLQPVPRRPRVGLQLPLI